MHSHKSDHSSHHANAAVATRSIDTPYYVRQALDLERTNTTTMYINFKHLEKSLHLEHIDHMIKYYYSLEQFLSSTVRDFLREVVPDYVTKDDTRHFSVSFYNFPRIQNVRQLKPENIGTLIAINAMATKSTRVSPEVLIGAFKCRDCDSVIKNVRQDFKITLPQHCINDVCTNKRFFDIIPQYSTFSDWQQLTVQESTDNLPAGSVPRTLKVILRNELVEVAKPGDHCIITGTLIAIPDVTSMYSRIEAVTQGNRQKDNPSSAENPTISGIKELGVREMAYKTALLATNITRLAAGTGATPYPDTLIDKLDSSSNPELFQSGLSMFTQAEIQAISNIKKDPNSVQLLVNSIAPHIYGHDLVKKGILFMLLGGVHKTTKDHASLRGDLNILLIGDPSTAKSSFLKFVADFIPRAVFTSGKASTAAGLTASVTRDSDSGEFVIEAGALMLADNGVCCIDEFDKMDQKDQSAIHEAMEQQTISIAKAGIQATLNARTSILAAANPISGRYDTTRTLKQNVNITPPIMSRFDLYFILVDQPTNDGDRMIAKHMISTHLGRLRQTRAKQLGELANFAQIESYDNFLATVPKHSTSVIPPETLRAYIRYARQLNPVMSLDAQQLIIKKYADLRDRDSHNNTVYSYKVTVRQLESMIRLSEACARLHMSNTITVDHVREAVELLHRSIVNVKPSSSLMTLLDDDPENDDDDGFGGCGDNDDDNGDNDGRGDGCLRGDDEDNDTSFSKKRKRGQGPFDIKKKQPKQEDVKDETGIKREQVVNQESEDVGDSGDSAKIITKDDYIRTTALVAHHLTSLRDEHLAEAVTRAEAEVNAEWKDNQEARELEIAEIRTLLSSPDLTLKNKWNLTERLKQLESDPRLSVEKIAEIENNLQVITPNDLLAWLMAQNPLYSYISTNYPIPDDCEEDSPSYKKIMKKRTKAQKKVYKLVLRRMLLNDHSIVNHNGYIEVQKDTSLKQVLRGEITQRPKMYTAPSEVNVFKFAGDDEEDNEQRLIDENRRNARIKSAIAKEEKRMERLAAKQSKNEEKEKMKDPTYASSVKQAKKIQKNEEFPDQLKNEQMDGEDAKKIKQEHLDDDDDVAESVLKRAARAKKYEVSDSDHAENDDDEDTQDGKVQKKKVVRTEASCKTTRRISHNKMDDIDESE